MITVIKKSIILFSLLFVCFLLLGFPTKVESNLIAERPLEVEYPEVRGAELKQVETPLPEYVKYIYYFIISITGIIALGALIIGGFQYLSSAGKPENLKRAREQILAAFWGVIILLSSYIIFSVIHPSLISFQLEELPEIQYPPPPPIPIFSVPTKDLLGRIKQLTKTIKEIPETIGAMAEELESLTNQCNCQNTKPLCVCTGGALGSVCQPRTCFTGTNSHPCPDSERIKELQKTIVDWRDIILYYKIRALSEKDDLTIDVERFLTREFSWYNEQIEVHRAIQSQSPGEAEKEQTIIEHLEEKKQWLEEEINYKRNLIEKLEELANSISKIKLPITQLAELSGQCFSNVGLKCIPSCKQGGTYGCHDRLSGCQPDKCSGGNPCPITGSNGIQAQVQEINPLPGEIIGICDEIISIINAIPKEREEKIIL